MAARTPTKLHSQHAETPLLPHRIGAALLFALLTSTIACSGLRRTLFTVTIPPGMGDRVDVVVASIAPSLAELGFEKHEGPDRVTHWSGVGRVGVRIGPEADKVVVAVSETFTGFSRASPEYRSTRDHLHVLLRERFGERNVAIAS